jgi:hypothetical protein
MNALHRQRWSCLWLLLVIAWLASASPAQELPWRHKGTTGNQALNLSPRELLAKWHVDNSHWDLLLDGRPQVGEESETVTRILYRMPDVTLEQWNAWCKTQVDPAALEAAPKEEHGNGYFMRGRATHVESVELLKELVPLYEFRKFYRVTIAIEGSPHPIIVSTRKIPAMWKDATDLDEPVRVQAIFLKAGEAEADKTPLYFVAARLAWFPDQVHSELGTTEDHVWLAQRGMDVALWDEVRANNGAAIGTAESECFYQLLTCVKGATPEQLKTLPTKPFDLPELLTKSELLLGQSYVCTGAARRVQRVTVPEQFRKRLGLDHYYEIDIFVPLGDRAIKLTPAPGQKDAPTFTDGFPTTFCVVKLPAGLEEGDNLYKQVKLRGVFFKLWAYQSAYMKKFNKNMRQPSPLLIGLEPQVVATEASEATRVWIPTAVMFTILAGVLAIWFFAWRATRTDKNFERKVLRKYTRGQDVNLAEIETPPPPSDPPH